MSFGLALLQFVSPARSATVIAVDKGPPSAEIKLGETSWRMFCGPQGVSWHTDGEEAKAAASVDQGAGKGDAIHRCL